MSVYTVVDAEALNAFLEDYEVGSLTHFEGISAGIENTNYFVDTTQGRYVLTIFEHHTFEELPYFLNIMAFMAEHDIPTAHPIATRQQTYLKSIQNKPAALVARLQGKTLEHPTLRQCQVMGQEMARFHLAGQGYDQYRANDRDIDWMVETFALISSHLPVEMSDKIRQELAFQSQQSYAELPQGVIHADLFCDNAMFDGDQLTGIIDLYYACNAAWLYDLAVMVNDWCRLPDNTFDSDKITAMVNAYQQQRPLTAQEKQLWPAVLRLAALRFWLSRLKDKVMPREGEMTQIKDPAVFEAVLAYHQKHTQSL